MFDANYSKPTERELNRTESELLMLLAQMSNRKFAELADVHESKISRTDWRFIAKVICIAGMAAEVSPLGRALQDLYKAIGYKKVPTALTVETSQITLEF
ncbi:CII family transcriptional regulator [Pantoea sp. LMR881]|uniref:CII family transcriptional regulator n=1 Tax=Pantoea sp. LMR881 TaxID=3014336 RepID=UPI0022AED917|nr:CII family transcriptional regulator [Pantoea sp. LMR881]MCZ4057822.1 CII family transcriptional regulator [Pantoea sp. LMR881]MCZ4058065.1 CII family transcriptional regulator [Pantoea sp. LMR881]